MILCRPPVPQVLLTRAGKIDGTPRSPRGGCGALRLCAENCRAMKEQAFGNLDGTRHGPDAPKPVARAHAPPVSRGPRNYP